MSNMKTRDEDRTDSVVSLHRRATAPKPARRIQRRNYKPFDPFPNMPPKPPEVSAESLGQTRTEKPPEAVRKPSIWRRIINFIRGKK